MRGRDIQPEDMAKKSMLRASRVTATAADASLIDMASSNKRCRQANTCKTTMTCKSGKGNVNSEKNCYLVRGIMLQIPSCKYTRLSKMKFSRRIKEDSTFYHARHKGAV